MSREWINELRSTARDSLFDEASDVVAQALRAFDAEDYAAAVRLAERAKSLANRSGLVREFLGLCLYRQERWQQAARELLTFKRLTNSMDQNHVIADCYRALGRPDRALEICNEVSRGRVSEEIWAEVCIVAAGAHADRGELTQALNSLSRAEATLRAIQPYQLKLWYVKGDLLDRAGRPHEARKFWELIASVDPEYFDVGDKLRS